MAESVELEELLDQVGQNLLSDVLVGIPGRVESYNAETTTATVKPLVSNPIESETGETVYEDIPPLASVPVAFPRGGGYAVQFDLSSGDTGVLLLLGLDIRAWFTSGEPSNPTVGRRHGLVAPVFIPGLVAKDQSIGSTGGMVVGEVDGSVIHVSAGVIRIGSSSASERLARGDTLTTWLANHVHPVAGSPPADLAGGVSLAAGSHLSTHRVE